MSAQNRINHVKVEDAPRKIEPIIERSRMHHAKSNQSWKGRECTTQNQDDLVKVSDVGRKIGAILEKVVIGLRKITTN